jgi:transcriptional regulator with XRE-family HTH domain
MRESLACASGTVLSLDWQSPAPGVVTKDKTMPRQSTTHVDNPADVGRRLREARVAAGISQTALAFPGCTAGYLSRIEAGQRIPSLQVIRELATRLGVDESWLACGADGAENATETGLRDAELALRLDQLDEAEQLFDELLDEVSSDSERWRLAAGLGHLAFRRDELESAIEHFEEALRIEPDLWDEAALDALGRAYFRTGDTESSIALYRAARELAHRRSRLRRSH